MNDLSILGKESVTMSSLEIAKLTGKEHFNVMRDIENTLRDAGIGAIKFEGSYKTLQNKDMPCYNLPRRECDLVISGYSVKYRLAIIDRWQELESQKQKQLPQTYLSALKELVLVTEANEQLLIENKVLVGKDRINSQVIGAQRADVHWLENRLENEIENKKLYGWRR